MNKPTTVTRAPKPKTGGNFARILNATLQDTRLSFRARGVLAFVLSKPTDWLHSAEKLSSLSPEGVDAVKSALRELATLGYLERRTVQDQSGKLRTTLNFSEEPKAINPPSVDGENRQGKNRQSVNRPPGQAPLGQPPLGQPTAGKAASLETTVRNDGLETKDRNHTQEIGEGDSMVSLVWEALATADNVHGRLTDDGRESLHKAAKDIRTASPDVTPDEINRRHRNLKTMFPSATMGATALAKHWARCASLRLDPNSWAAAAKRQRERERLAEDKAEAKAKAERELAIAGNPLLDEVLAGSQFDQH